MKISPELTRRKGDIDFISRFVFRDRSERRLPAWAWARTVRRGSKGFRAAMRRFRRWLNKSPREMGILEYAAWGFLSVLGSYLLAFGIIVGAWLIWGAIR